MQEITEKEWLQKPEAERNNWQEVWYFWNKHMEQWEESGLNPNTCGVSFEAWAEYLGKSPEQVKRIYREASFIQGEGETMEREKANYASNEFYNQFKSDCPDIDDEVLRDARDYFRVGYLKCQEDTAALLSAKDKEIAELKQQLNSK